jgi:hypothetical protein
MNPNDVIRDLILRYLHDRHTKARGPKGVSVKVSDIQKELRESGYKQGQTSSNLDYLIQKGWVVEVVTRTTFTTKSGIRRHQSTSTYKISDIGIDRLEEGSVYRRPESHPGISIVNVKGVTIVGDGNVVNTELAELSRALNRLEQAVADSSDLKDEDKLDLVANIGSIQSHISSPRPKRDLIKKIWHGIEKTVIATRFAELVGKVSSIIGALD